MKNLLRFVIISLVAGYSHSFAQGIVRGKVTDQNGETLIGVPIVLKSNRSVGTLTDLDGNYSLQISDIEAQTIVVSFFSFQTIEETVHPVNNEVIIRNFVLNPATHGIKEVEITAKAVKAKDYYMEKMKMNSSATLDYVSSETMKKTGDANVVSAVARVSGVSTNGGLITVRGIGDRYVRTTINGSLIPTLDPFTNNIKLDLFPSSLVDNIIITKTASPDLPGDWAGAYLSVETKDYPDQLSVNIESSFGYNKQSTFTDVLTSEHSSTDWLGYDNGLRDHNHADFTPVIANPSPYQEFVALGLGPYFNSLGVTNESWIIGSASGETYYKLALVELGLLAPAQFDDGNAVANAKAQYDNGPYRDQAFVTINTNAAQSGQSFPNNWDAYTRKAPLGYSQSFSIGSQTRLFGRPFGLLAGFRYGNSIAYDPSSTASRANVNADGEIIPASITDQKFCRETNGWSALMNLAYKYSPNHSLSFLFMPNQIGVNKLRDAVNNEESSSSTYFYNLTKNQFYEERRQMIYQLRSEHYIPGPKLKIELNASYTNGKSNVPDFKNLEFFADQNLAYQFDRSLSNTHRYYRYLSDNFLDSRLSAEMPIGNKADLPRKIKFGGAYQNNIKEFNQYDYALNFNTGSSLIIEDNDIERFFNLDKFGITTNEFGKTIDLYYLEAGLPANHTIGFSKILAGFAMLDYTIIPRLRFAGGLRVEKATIFSDVYKYDSLGLVPNDLRRYYQGDIFLVNPGKLDELSFLPSANLIYKLKNDALSPINVRLNFSQTVARPSIREISETIARDYELNADVFGNSELKMVEIDNYDLRLESYFKSGDNISMSLFYKDFDNHIELVNSNQGFTWINVDKSRIMGMELEGKKVLTKGLELRSNVTFINSRTTFVQTILRVQNGGKTYIPIDTVSRAMFGQAPYVINCMLSYTYDSLGLSTSISYNVQGPRLVLTSTDKIPDVYELPRHLLDLKISKSLGRFLSTSLTVRDILNSPVRRSYRNEGQWIFDFDRYTYGTSYNLSIAYKL